jgi:tetratricopeptide (TPR) repeat protein
MSEAFRQQKNYQDAFEAAGRAILLMPQTPTAYVHAAQALLGMNDYERVLLYCEQAKEKVKNLKGEMVSSPRAVMGLPDLLIAQVFCVKGEWQRAIPHIEAARPYFSDTRELSEIDEWCKSMCEHQLDKDAFQRIADKMWREKKYRAVHALAINAPGNLPDTGEVARLIPKKRPADRKSIAFICGDNFFGVHWGPWSIKSGIGGSEEAVINAAREFVKAGWHVEVYCALGKKRSESPVIADGVEYWPIHCWTGEYDNPLDVIVWWRAPRAVEVVAHRSALNYAWMHDIHVPGSWGEKTHEVYDGVFLLSDYHRKLHSFLPDDKVILTENGLDPDLFVPIEKFTNEPHRMIYGSDPCRGFQYILPHWKRIREEVPDAEIHVFYGWSRHFMESTKSNPEHKRIYEYVEANRNQDGIHWRGKVGQEQLAKEYAKSGIWGYPTTFPEIHCITALKAQAHGCTPIVTDDFALSQTVKFGKKLPGPMTDPERIKNWVDEVIFQMKHPQSRGERLEMATWARTHTWAAVVRGWLGHFEKHLALKPPVGTASLTLTPTN